MASEMEATNIWIAPYGSEPLGHDSSGVPVVCNEEGVGQMRWIGKGRVVFGSEDE